MPAPVVLPDVLHPAAASVVMPDLAQVVWLNDRLQVSLFVNGAAPATVREVAKAVFNANGVDFNLNYRFVSNGGWALYSAGAPAVYPGKQSDVQAPLHR